MTYYQIHTDQIVIIQISLILFPVLQQIMTNLASQTTARHSFREFSGWLLRDFSSEPLLSMVVFLVAQGSLGGSGWLTSKLPVSLSSQTTLPPGRVEPGCQPAPAVQPQLIFTRTTHLLFIWQIPCFHYSCVLPHTFQENSAKVQNCPDIRISNSIFGLFVF